MAESLEEFRAKVEGSKETSTPPTESKPEPIQKEPETPREPQPEPKPKSRFESIKEKAGSAISKAKEKVSGAANYARTTTAKAKAIFREKPSAYKPVKIEQAKAIAKERQEKLKSVEATIKAEAKARFTESKEAIKSIGKDVHKAGEKTGEKIKESSVYKGAQLGFQETKEKFKTGVQEGAHTVGREIGRAPLTVAKYGVSKAKEFQANVRVASKKGWHAGLLEQAPRKLSGGKFLGTGRYLGKAPSFHPHATIGRQPRVKIPKGLIKPYWSKKLKKLARSNIRKFGTEEGLARTKQVAELSGWKMQ